MSALITTGAAAAILGVEYKTAARYLDEGKLTGYVLPSGHRRITLESVMALKATREEAGRE